MPKTTREKGNYGENIAVSFLKSKGYRIIERNHYTSHTELDIIALSPEGDTVVFVEVKARSEAVAEHHGRPAFAVGKVKQRNLIFAAEGYMKTHPQLFSGRRTRIDVIEVYMRYDALPQVRHIRSAVTVRPGYNK